MPSARPARGNGSSLRVAIDYSSRDAITRSLPQALTRRDFHEIT
jgi:hypothetical protein